MIVTKILETTLNAGQTTVTFTDSDIPNSLLRVYTTDSDIFPISQVLSGNTLTVTYEAQSSNMGIALEIAKQGLVINDTLESEASNEALSAKQGAVLKGLIDNIIVPSTLPASSITYDNTTTGISADDVQDAIDMVFQSVSDGKILIAGAITDKGVETSASDTFQTMATNISLIPTGGSGGEAVGFQVAGTGHLSYSYTAQSSGNLYASLSGYGNPNYGGATQLTVNNVAKSVTKAWTQGSSQAGFRVWENIPVNANDVIKIEYGTITQSGSFMGIIAIV